ncbi:MAG: ABC transporter ATP-binding protein, partial [Deltaproteobacteria bacterium]
RIGAVLEGTRNVYWRLSAWENLMYFGRLKGCSGTALKERAKGLLQELELWDHRDTPVRRFSRGMQQKVAIACALISDPPVVLLDEPTLGLDVQTQRTVKGWIERLAREEGKTVVLTSHHLGMVQEVCDRVAIIRKGELIADKPLSALLDLFRETNYRIRLEGCLNGQETQLPEGVRIVEEAGEGETLLDTRIANEEEIYELLDRIRTLGFPLLSVSRVEPDLEEVFMRLIEEGS